MIQDIHTKLNPELPRQEQQSKRRRVVSTPIALNLRKKLVKWYIWNTAIYGAETY
jgi:hypothetical protein